MFSVPAPPPIPIVAVLPVDAVKVNVPLATELTAAPIAISSASSKMLPPWAIAALFEITPPLSF